MSTAIVWFRRDLRLADQPALSAACAAHERVLPVFIHAPHEDGAWTPGAASRWWLHHSLVDLRSQLREQGVSLHVRRGDSLAALRDLIDATGASAVYWNRLYEPAAIARDRTVKSALRGQGVEAHSFNASLWREPWQVETRQGAPYRVFTPFWRSVRTQLPVTPPLARPSMHGIDVAGGLPIDALELLPSIPWDGGLRDACRPGERGAQEALEIFQDDAMSDYATARDVPARHGTSRLSPHLHFGEISPRQIHHALAARAAAIDARRRPDIEPFLRELGWREFSHHLLYHFPSTPEANFDSRFDRFAWQADNGSWLERWQRGRTGIPLVDAGMRELWHTGWMHNRVRMVVASFLCKNLRQHWRHGARWFWDTLVDADLANNTLGWQWVAGSGADAAPYFRVFNPVSQAQKFDAQGEYLRRWLPELRAAPLPLLHEPWKDAALLKRWGYPAPMIDLGESRAAALRAYQSMRGK
ncbi:deoxyribodipyrimidine photo-lyase [Dyella sp. EPa41]|uniref:cryptochrome/photolyase family protein n=1 Tax=Dyella sp. EPa41 TaxID=1561194 RepID=UPI0019151D03|nr:deoxyribodipyrimidine photo-lyase [Dyella sp. EPa41]